MAALAASIADTVAGMQRVLAKDHYSSESDEPYLQSSNRGNKLKRKAKHISGRYESDLVGPKPYKRTIKHAGYNRAIIRRNPKRYDEDGDELATDDEDEEADARAAEENPYSEIKLEQLLAPLTAAAKLPNHPSMSFAYTSTMLSDMAQQACKMVQKERKALSNAKKLLTELMGDATWIPTGNLEASYDDEMFDTKNIYEMIVANAPINGMRQRARNLSNDNFTYARPNGTARPATSPDLDTNGIAADGETDPNHARPRDDAQHLDLKDTTLATKDFSIRKTREHSPTANYVPNRSPTPEGIEISDYAFKRSDKVDEIDLVEKDKSATGVKVGSEHHQPAELPLGTETDEILPSVEGAQLDEPQMSGEAQDQGREQGIEAMDEGSRSPPRRITRAQAQADKVTATSRSDSPDNWVPPPIHPLFLIPSTARTDPDFGLPPNEAHETRQLLTAYVQKQEEVCRVAERLYSGLLQADRNRKAVLSWCKAEGHIGEMSDGEDWYDKEEWGLEEDLRKGHAEEEEETTVQGKKTRRRV